MCGSNSDRVANSQVIKCLTILSVIEPLHVHQATNDRFRLPRLIAVQCLFDL